MLDMVYGDINIKYKKVQGHMGGVLDRNIWGYTLKKAKKSNAHGPYWIRVYEDVLYMAYGAYWIGVYEGILDKNI